jgi:hypothetical protein
MEYGSEIDIFVLKMMMKSSPEKIILKFLHVHSLCGNSFLLHRKEDFCKK